MFSGWTLKKFLTRTAKVIGIILLSVVTLLILLALIIQIPAVQRKIVDKAVSFVSNKIGTPFSLDHFSLSFPKAIVLEGLYLEDQHTDTLLYIRRLSIDTDLWALTRNTIELNDVTLENASVRVTRSATDSTFNFDYIIKAFAGTEQQPDTTASEPWTFNVEDISLTAVQASYIDSLQGMNVRVDLGNLEVGVDDLNLEGPAIQLGNVLMRDTRASVLSWIAPSEIAPGDSSDITPPGKFSISFKEIQLDDIAADYHQTKLGQRARLNLGHFLVQANEIDLPNEVLDLESIILSNTFISYQQAPSVDKGGNVTQQTGSQTTAGQGDSNNSSALTIPWRIVVDRVELTNNNVQYYDFNAARLDGAVDFNHLWLTRLNFSARDLFAHNDQLRASFETLAFSERSGFSLNNLQALVTVSDKEASIRDLQIETSHSSIKASVASAYASLASIGERYPDATLDLQVQPSSIAVRDVLYFAPTLLNGVPIHLPEDAILNIQTAASGAVRDLRLRSFNVSFLDSTTLSLDGTVTGLPGKNPRFAVSLRKFYTTRADVRALLPDTLLPSAIELPEWVALTGTARGSATDPVVNILLDSDLGSARVNGSMKSADQPNAAYRGSLDVNAFDLGKLLRQSETMGELTMHAEVDGRGLSKETINTRVDMVVRQFQYQGYAYRDFNVHGRLIKYLFSGDASMHDPNLDFTIKGDLDYTGDIPEYALKFSLVNADFNALHLSERPLKARGIFEARLATRDFTSINGNVDIRKVGIYNGDALYLVDSLLFASIDQEGESSINIRSDIVSGDFEGTINLAAMPETLRRHFNNYFSLRDSTYNKPAGVQKFTFNLVLKNTELITEILVPELEPFVPGKIEGNFDSEEKSLNLEASVSRLRYGGIGMDSLTLKVRSDEDALDYTLGLRKIVLDTLRMEALRVTGRVASYSIRTSLLILDSALREKYSLGGAFYSEQEAIQFRFLPGEVRMNYAPWTTPADNYLRFTRQGILAHNFSITNINESISLVTREEKDARTAIEFKDLNLQNLTNVVEGKVLADGLINGDFMLSGTGQFRTELGIKALEIFGVEWGDLALKLSHENSGQYLIDMGVNGVNMEFGAKGTYLPDSAAAKLDVLVDVSRINLVAIEPLTAGQLKNSAGRISGEITVQGNPVAPDIRGFLSFQDAAVVPSFANTRFLLKDERIAFTAAGVELENFRILDEQNNAAVIKGTLKTKNYTTFDMNLRLTAQNFQLLNSAEGQNELFYGKVGINTNATVSGTLTAPKIDMNIAPNDDSKFTYIIPQSEKGVLEQQGIVVFKDKDALKDPFLASIEARDTVASGFTGLELTANIELDGKEELSIVIDPLTGDKLTVKGNASLTLDINPSGDMQMSGRYEITEGTYDFTFYKLVKRNFKIEKGSSITWSGNPLEATMDISASYEVETSPMELLQLTSSTAEPIYRQRLPFLVFLNIDGELMAPDITFALDMPQEKRGALSGRPYARIQEINTNESDLNKQVFALLILQRFVTDDVFDNQSGSSVSATARRSVSKLLTEQLNKMSQNIKGVELTFDLRSDEDYSTGDAQGQTELQLGVSKSLLDDRLVVKVSGNVDIEGNKANQGSFADYIGDLALEYKLTEDGRFRVTGFRNSNYDIISGELIETGAGLIYIKDYDALKELFKANTKPK